MEAWFTTFGGILGVLGGGSGILAFVSQIVYRRQNKRIKNAEADNAEMNAEVSEFSYLKERLIFAEQQNVEKEKRFAEQTQILRKANADIVDLWQRLFEEQKTSAKLELELNKKRCDRRKCPDREPPSDY